LSGQKRRRECDYRAKEQAPDHQDISP